MRTSQDEFDINGCVKNGFDYKLQVWIKNYIVQDCGHPRSMGDNCCTSHIFRGTDIRSLEKGGD